MRSLRGPFVIREHELRLLRALERIADAEERRNALLEEEAAWRRDAYARDQQATADRWADLIQPDTTEEARD